VAAVIGEGSSGGGCYKGRGSPAAVAEGAAVVVEEGGGSDRRRGWRQQGKERRWQIGARWGQELTFYTRLLGFGGDSSFLGHNPTIPAQLYRINSN
jgi:hypothetical protein